MDLIKNIYKELEKLGLSKENYLNLKEIQNKDGIYLFRVIYGNSSYILKYFKNIEYTREIKNYFILKELNIPTIKVVGYTDKSLLLEDLEKSKTYRLGIESDLSDIEVAEALAEWYKKLHNEGAKYVSNKDNIFYREVDVITKENIELIKNRTKTEDNHVWQLIIDNLDLIFTKIGEVEQTLTYNDFYWTNLAVSHDKKEAIMFDYNFLGIGFRYNDIRNVCLSLSKEARKAFVEKYGKTNETEKIIDNGISILITLIFAYARPEFPKWGQESLKSVYSGELEKAIIKILEL